MRTLVRFAPAISYISLIWYLSSGPISVNISHCDKIVHVIEYGILGFLIAYGLDLNKSNFKKTALLAVTLSILAGISDEFHQYFVPGRSCDAYDALADLIGSALGVASYFSATLLLSYVNSKLVGKTN